MSRNLNAGEPQEIGSPRTGNAQNVLGALRDQDRRLASAITDSSRSESYFQEEDYSDAKAIRDDFNNDEIEVPIGRDWDDQPTADSGYSFGNYNINIEPITSGFIIKVGCQTIAVEEGTDVAKLVKIYLSGDKTIGSKWMSSEKNVQKFIKEHLQD